MEIQNKLWILSSFSAIIAIISILAPAWGVVVSSYSFFVWFWGLEVSTDMGIRFLEPAFVAYGVTTTILIGISVVALLFSSNLNRKTNKDVSLIWGFFGLLIILSSIIYVVGLEFAFPGLLADENHSTALIGPLISGISAIMAGFAFKFLKR